MGHVMPGNTKIESAKYKGILISAAHDTAPEPAKLQPLSRTIDRESRGLTSPAAFDLSAARRQITGHGS